MKQTFLSYAAGQWSNAHQVHFWIAKIKYGLLKVRTWLQLCLTICPCWKTLQCVWMKTSVLLPKVAQAVPHLKLLFQFTQTVWYIKWVWCPETLMFFHSTVSVLFLPAVRSNIFSFTFNSYVSALVLATLFKCGLSSARSKTNNTIVIMTPTH